MESRLLADRLATVSIEKPIYIAGLARSGTTILLELLNRHPQLVSHRYRDFPPILTPWLWNWFVERASTREQTPQERAHGDGIRITPDSPEAFEEVIWMTFFPNLHDPDTCSVLTAEVSNPEFEKFYRDHISKLLLIRRGNRYLSKANYNVQRLAYLLKLFPDARFILPVRDPNWHIASLMRQHTRFCREHQRDIRLQQHMSRAGHFEFGLDRRPVNNGNTAVTRKIRTYWSSEQEIDGWALYWRDVYGYVADLLTRDPAIRQATLVIDYQRLCNQPRQMTEAVVDHCDLPTPDNIKPLQTAAADIWHPAYYRPSFSAAQMARIEAITRPVKDQLLALAA